MCDERKEALRQCGLAYKCESVIAIEIILSDIYLLISKMHIIKPLVYEGYVKTYSWYRLFFVSYMYLPICIYIYLRLVKVETIVRIEQL